MLDEHGRLKRPGHRAGGEPADEAGDLAPLSGAYVRRYADPRYWHAVVRKRRLAALGVVAVVVAVGALVALGWIAVVWPGLGTSPEQADAVRTRIPDTSPGSAAATGPAPASGTESRAATGSTDPASAAGRRAPLVAYRREGAIWIAAESGESARRVLAWASGVYSLSPDATRLAVVDGSTGRLSIVDVATGEKKEIGPAADARPEWSPDSQWLLYSRTAGAEEEIVRIAAGGHGETVLMRGVKGRFVGGPDLAIAAPRRATLPSQVVAVLSDGRTIRVPQKVRSVEVCPGPHGVYVVGAGDGAVAASIRYVAYEGDVDLTLVPSPVAGAAVTLSDLSVSPDGKWLVYTETRDDGYSRMFARQSSGLRSIPLKTHRDSYLVGWSADGSEILRIEGNAAQGESTRLTALHPDGTGWRVVVEGAGL